MGFDVAWYGASWCIYKAGVKMYNMGMIYSSLSRSVGRCGRGAT